MGSDGGDEGEKNESDEVDEVGRVVEVAKDLENSIMINKVVSLPEISLKITSNKREKYSSFKISKVT